MPFYEHTVGHNERDMQYAYILPFDIDFKVLPLIYRSAYANSLTFPKKKNALNLFVNFCSSSLCVSALKYNKFGKYISVGRSQNKKQSPS